MNEKSLVIAIDGPAGAGKSAAARLLAQRLGLAYVDTGAMYRAVALLALEAGIPLPPRGPDKELLIQWARDLEMHFSGPPLAPQVFLGAREVSMALRGEEVSRAASLVSAIPEIRQELVQRQRALGAQGAVVEGRDIGTVVFPEAPVKFFLTARPEVRARRRLEELAKQGRAADLRVVTEEIRQRDLRDSSREVAPLRPAPDALVVDTSDLSLEAVVSHLERVTRQRLGPRLAGSRACHQP
ncbi:MAG: (d)CMP kinase [Thermoanaerobaculum sp.]|nr:(d)CMP kinase [Thermoanaerobaculum sp.]MDW7966583.1 (d)CMP kinase [Thermoanaerobaculum sp.]